MICTLAAGWSARWISECKIRSFEDFETPIARRGELKRLKYLGISFISTVLMKTEKQSRINHIKQYEDK